MFSKILLILSGNAAAAILTLLRNLLVARLISVEDYGIAATFAIVMTLVEMVSAFGLQQLVVQSKTDDPSWQDALQGFQLLRAVIAAGLLFICAPQIATFLGVPDIAWAYQVLALAPLMNGCVHLDIYRLNRKMVYLPLILAQTLPALISLLMIWPLWLLFGDWRVMLIAVVAQWTLMALISILWAERRWNVRLDKTAISDALIFGWPLLINNILLFAVLNGEKLIVGREISMAALAIFAMGFTLTLTPTLVMARSIQSFFLPQLSAVQDADSRFQPLARTTIEANFFNGALLLIGIILVGEPFVQIVLGEKYQALLPLMTWLALLQAIRVLKAGGAVVALARAQTSNAMISNMFRVLSLPISWWVAVTTGDLLLVIWIAILSELLGLAASLYLVRTRAGVILRPLVPLFGATTALMIVATLFAAQPDVAWLNGLPRWPLAAICLVLFGVMIATMQASKGYLKNRRLEQYES